VVRLRLCLSIDGLRVRSRVQPNVSFEVDDAERKWTWPVNHFDLVHSRDIAQSIKDWGKLTAQIFRHTAPGGYAELVEDGTRLYSDDGTLPVGSPLDVYIKSLNEALTVADLPPMSSARLQRYLTDAGFVDVSVRTVKIPWNVWAKSRVQKEIGAYMMMVCETGLEAYGLAALTRVLRMDVATATKLCSDAFAMLKDRRVHTYSVSYRAVGRKPA